MARVKVLVVDKREIFRRGLAKLLESEPDLNVVGTSLNVYEAAKRIGGLKPDVILIDTEGLGSKSIEAIRYISELWPQVRVIILSHSEGKDDLFLTYRAGVSGYISKDITVEHLIKAITLVADGEVVISPPMASELIKEFTSLEGIKEEVEGKGSTDLSKREGEVLTLVAKGATNKEIAATLFIAPNTVKVHLRNILEKLHVRNRQQAAALVLGKGTHLIRTDT